MSATWTEGADLIFELAGDDQFLVIDFSENSVNKSKRIAASSIASSFMQTPWLSNIDGNEFNLFNVDNVQVNETVTFFDDSTQVLASSANGTTDFVSTGLLINNLSPVSPQTGVSSLFFRLNGTNMFSGNDVLTVYNYDITTTPWDISSLPTPSSFTSTGNLDFLSGIFISLDGLLLFLTGLVVQL